MRLVEKFPESADEEMIGNWKKLVVTILASFCIFEQSDIHVWRSRIRAEHKGRDIRCETLEQHEAMPSLITAW